MWYIILFFSIYLDWLAFARQRVLLELGRQYNRDFRYEFLPMWIGALGYITPVLIIISLSNIFDIAWYFAILCGIAICFFITLLPIPSSMYDDAKREIGL